MVDESSLRLLWSDSALLSTLIWALLSILTLYLARRPAHELLDRLGQALSNILRLGSSLLLKHARRTAARQRNILRAAANDIASRRIERQLRRISSQVDRHLSEYPRLHRTLSEQVERIQSDYQHAGDTPPAPPVWLDAIAAVANIEANDDPAVAAILKDMHATLESACHEAMLEYQAANRRRFYSLRRMQPYFSRLASTLEQIQHRLERVTGHAQAIDIHMEKFEALHQQRKEPIQRLNFDLHLRAISGIALLTIVVLAGLLSHSLLAQPVQAVLGMNLAPEHAWVATTALMLIALGLGIWIAESLEVTRLLGVAWQLTDQQRHYLAAAGVVLLIVLATLHGMLAWSAHVDVVLGTQPWWFASTAAAMFAAIITFVIALAAIPLEMIVHSAPALLSNLLAKLTHLLAAILRLFAAIAAALPLPLKKAYDLWVFLPLWVEQAIQNARNRESETAAEVSENP